MIKSLHISHPNEKILLPFDREKPFCKIVAVEIVSDVIESIPPGAFHMNYYVEIGDLNTYPDELKGVDFKRPGKLEINETIDLRGKVKSLAFEFRLRNSLPEFPLEFNGQVILHYELIDKLDTSIPTAGFDEHLADSRNVKILFSAPFGQGKSTFLDYYFAERADQYNVFKLFPVNYSVAKNEDVFKYIKTDIPVSYTHLRAHETVLDLVCRLLLEKKNK